MASSVWQRSVRDDDSETCETKAGEDYSKIGQHYAEAYSNHAEARGDIDGYAELSVYDEATVAEQSES